MKTKDLVSAVSGFLFDLDYKAPDNLEMNYKLILEYEDRIISHFLAREYVRILEDIKKISECGVDSCTIKNLGRISVSIYQKCLPYFEYDSEIRDSSLGNRELFELTISRRIE